MLLSELNRRLRPKQGLVSEALKLLSIVLIEVVDFLKAYEVCLSVG